MKQYHLRRFIFSPAFFSENFCPYILGTGEHYRYKIRKLLVFRSLHILACRRLLRLIAHDIACHIAQIATRDESYDSDYNSTENTASDPDGLTRYPTSVFYIAASATSVNSHKINFNIFLLNAETRSFGFKKPFKYKYELQAEVFPVLLFSMPPQINFYFETSS